MTLTSATAVAPTEASVTMLEDEQCFKAFYLQHARYIAGVVFRISGHDGDIDDVVQETFLAASSHLHQLREPRAARAWLAAIAVREVKRQLARRRRQRLLSFCMGQLAAPASDPEQRRAVDEMYDALDRLPPDLRIPWVLARIEQFTLPDAAMLCDVSLATVKRRIAEAEQRLQRILDR
jgi:RNA polymerase sigma-70 factor (ECF subfamily)